jgi:hypothetical protein
MSEEYCHPAVWEKVRNYLTPEALDGAKLEVFSMRITDELGGRLRDYIAREKLQTFSQNRKNGRRVDFVYAPNFSIKRYLRQDGTCSSCFIDGGAIGYARSSSRNREEYRLKEARCMKRVDLYFAILKKYPEHLLDVIYSQSIDAAELLA